MRRRDFFAALGGAVGWPLAARAQQPAMPVVGVMSPLSVAAAARNLSSLRNGLRDLGYSEGRNVKIEARFADGVAERFPLLVADLLSLKPDVILVGSTTAILAAARALDLDARVYEVRSGAALEAAFAAAVRDGVQALYVPEAPLLLTRRA